MLLSPRLYVALVIVTVTFFSDVTMRFLFFRFCSSICALKTLLNLFNGGLSETRSKQKYSNEETVCVLFNVHTQILQHGSRNETFFRKLKYSGVY